MMLLDKTTERLRSKHVRTLELLQKTLDENVELRDRVSQLQKVAPRSNRTSELEDEIDRLKAEHCAKLMATEEAARVRHEELFKTIATLQTQHQKLQNDVFSLETRLFNARETLQHERAQWHQERERLQHDNQTLQQEIELNAYGRSNSHERHQNELASLQREVETLRLQQHDAETRNEQLREEISSLCSELKQQKDQIADQREQLDAANQQLEAANQRDTALKAELAAEREQRRRERTDPAVPQKTEQLKPPIVIVPSITPRLHHHHQQQQQQQQPNTAVLQSQLQQMEASHTRLVTENRALQESLTKMQTHVAELNRQAATTALHTNNNNNNSSSSIFATHVDLKRENFNLRAQVEELKQLQRRFLTTANKKTMKFPPL